MPIWTNRHYTSTESMFMRQVVAMMIRTVKSMFIWQAVAVVNDDYNGKKYVHLAGGGSSKW